MSETQPSILIIDDRPKILEALSELFEQHATVATAKTVQEAIDIISSTSPAFNVIIVDGYIDHSPGFDKPDGPELCRSLRYQQFNGTLIGYSSDTKLGSMFSAAGATAFVPKTDVEKLVELVKFSLDAFHV